MHVNRRYTRYCVAAVTATPQISADMLRMSRYFDPWLVPSNQT